MTKSMRRGQDIYRIAIVEDEPEYQSQLKRCIQAYEKEYEDCSDVYVSSDELDILDNYTADYDIILVGTQMKHLDGMKTVQSIRKMNGNVVSISITNMAQFAIQGYTTGTLDCVLKSVSELAFAQQLGKAVWKLKMRNHDTLIIIQGGSMIRFSISQISYVESQGHNIMIRLERGVYIIRSTMKEVGSRLENQHFSRCNNYFSVNLQHMEQIEQNRATVVGEELQINRPYKKVFMEALTGCVSGERGQRMQDTLKLYTALAEWLACLVCILLLKKRSDKYRMIDILAAALPLLCILRYYIGVLPVTLWIPPMIMAMLLMCDPILPCCHATCTGAAFCFPLVFIVAEFVASLE